MISYQGNNSVVGHPQQVSNVCMVDWWVLGHIIHSLGDFLMPKNN